MRNCNRVEVLSSIRRPSSNITTFSIWHPYPKAGRLITMARGGSTSTNLQVKPSTSFPNLATSSRIFSTSAVRCRICCRKRSSRVTDR